jgi:hypothetical protein
MNKPGGTRVNKLLRQEKVARWMAMHLSNGEIARRLQEEDKISRSAAMKDIAETFANLEYEARKDRPHLKNRMRQSLRAIVTHAMARKDFRAAVAANAQLCKIDGLYAPEKVEHSGDVGLNVDDVTTGDQRSRLAELLRRANERAAAKLGAIEVTTPTPTQTNGTNGTNGSAGH